MTMIAQIADDGSIIQVGDSADLYPDTTFPDTGPGADFMTANNCLFAYDTPPYNPVTQTLNTADQPYILDVNGVEAVFIYVAADMTSDQVTAGLVATMAAVSLQRNQYINKTNWTQCPDSGLSTDDVAAWATYRLAVRQTCQDFMDSDREVVPVWPAPPQDVDNYVLSFLSKGSPVTPGSGGLVEGDDTTPIPDGGVLTVTSPAPPPPPVAPTPPPPMTQVVKAGGGSIL